MLPDAAIKVVCDNDHVVHCIHCGKQLEPDEIAALTRTGRGKPFDAWCNLCLKILCVAAQATLDAAEVFSIEVS